MNEFYTHYSLVKKWRWSRFTPKEIACKGTGELVIDYEAMDKLQKFREMLGVPFSPNSAYRSETHNRKVGGAANSFHRKGMAFDIPINSKITRDAIHSAARRSGFRGIIDYKNFVHIDNRPIPYVGDKR